MSNYFLLYVYVELCPHLSFISLFFYLWTVLASILYVFMFGIHPSVTEASSPQDNACFPLSRVASPQPTLSCDGASFCSQRCAVLTRVGARGLSWDMKVVDCFVPVWVRENLCTETKKVKEIVWMYVWEKGRHTDRSTEGVTIQNVSMSWARSKCFLYHLNQIQI